MSCREWLYEEPEGKPARPFGLRAKQPKGHKWQREKEDRSVKVAKNLEEMPAKIAAYRVCRSLIALACSGSMLPHDMTTT